MNLVEFMRIVQFMYTCVSVRVCNNACTHSHVSLGSCCNGAAKIPHVFCTSVCVFMITCVCAYICASLPLSLILLSHSSSLILPLSLHYIFFPFLSRCLCFYIYTCIYCMRVCEYVRMSMICICIYTYTCIRTYIHKYIHQYEYIYMYIYMYIHTYIYRCLCIDVCVYAHMFTHISTHTKSFSPTNCACVHKYIYTNIWVCVHINWCANT